VDEGVALLAQWLTDLARRGFADAGLEAHATWDEISRRMVDAQATGLARRLRYAAEAARSGAGWEGRLMAEIGRLHVLLSACARREALAPEMRSEIEQQVGWTVPQGQVLAGPGVSDLWLVAARTVSEDDRLVTTETWLRGQTSGRWAQLLRASPAVQPAVDTWPPGKLFAGELVYYPGVEPVRALWKAEPQAASAADGSGVSEGAQAIESFASWLERHAAVLARNPWRTRLPALVQARLGRTQAGVALVDPTGAGLPLRANSEKQELLAAITGGHESMMSVLWNGEELEPLAVVDGGAWVPLTKQTLER
jgi:hypothetical protein